MTETPKEPHILFWKKVLNDATLGFLALVSFFLIFLPSVFDLPSFAQQAVTFIEYLIVAIFAAEYLVSWLAARDRIRFVRSWWRVIDALIIIAAVVAVVPAVPDVLRNSTAFRILRLGRLALLGTRSSLGLVKPPWDEDAIAEDAPDLAISALTPSGDGLEQISWEDGLNRLRNASADWLFVSGVNQDRLEVIADILKLPGSAVDGLLRSNMPRFDHLDRFTMLFVRYPTRIGPGPQFHRTPVLLAVSADNIVVLSRENTDLVQRIGARLKILDPALPRMTRATAGLLGEIVRAYTDVLHHLEDLLLRLESEQSGLKDENFISQAFALRTHILRVRGSVKYLRSVMRDLTSGDLDVHQQGADRRVFHQIADDVNDLYDMIEDLRESLQALVDLRLNVASFQMNRVMRLLALLTTLALIPATAGGLLGMNLLDAPWPMSLPQVAFTIASAMALSLYIFIIKGWLR